jgi:hypothetical protein
MSHKIAVQGADLDPMKTGWVLRPSASENARPRQNYKVCRFYHASAKISETHNVNILLFWTHYEFKIFGKCKSEDSKHAFKRVIRVVNSTTGR